MNLSEVYRRVVAARELARTYPEWVEAFDRETVGRNSISDDQRWCDCKPTDALLAVPGEESRG